MKKEEKAHTKTATVYAVNKEAYRKPPKASRKLQKFQGRNPEIISLLFWDKLIFHKDIIKSTDL